MADFHGPSVLDTSPHLAHYVFKLVLSNHTAAARNISSSGGSSGHHQHPLSVSSSGESDDDDDEEDDSRASNASTDGDARSASTNMSDPPNGRSSAAAGGPSREEREELVKKIIDLLDNDQEEDVKDLLREPMGELGKDDFLMDQVCLDCMHRRRDDMSGVPYQTGSFTPTRADRARRPFTPTGVGTLRARTPLARPHSPAIPSGAQTPTSTHGPSALSREQSQTSPTMAPGAPPSTSSGYSSSGSPVQSTSRAALNIKAASFTPGGGSGSGRGSPLTAINTAFAPSDPWRDAEAPPPRTGSPFTFGGAPGMVRTGSNRAIAAPIMSDPSSPFHSPLGTPTRSHMKLGNDTFPTSRPASRGVAPEEDDDDEFSPFGSGLPRQHRQQPSGLSTTAKPFEPYGGDEYGHEGASYGSSQSGDEDPQAVATAGMTPLDVLASVFSTVPRPELEDALHRSGYDFEAAMAMLVSQYTLPRSGASTPQRVASPRPMIGIDGRPAAPHAPGPGYYQQGRGFQPSANAAFANRNVGPTRMCRYFLNGECRRSDCRFSHDLERALCRFWLRGHCAKGPNCEFMHNLPSNMDPQSINAAMSRLDVSSPGGSRPGTPPVHGAYGAVDDFPDLLAARLNRHVGRFDPSRNRFANAVKRPAPAPPPQQISIGANATGRYTPSGAAPYSPASEQAPRPQAPAVPRPSQRVTLHSSTLLPTLQTGTAANDQYMQARATSIRLGNARNACLARAADAFRRGDGAAAKRFSREGKALNEKMLNEAADAAQTLVKERMRDAQKSVRERDGAWSDDPRDRVERGRECGAGLGVVLGVAAASKVPGGDRLSSEERLECLIDLHTLHGQEGADVASHFLAELERENYRGLAYLVVGEEKHVGTQDAARGAGKTRLASSVKQFLAEWGYAWNEHAGVLCVDPCR